MELTFSEMGKKAGRTSLEVQRERLRVLFWKVKFHMPIIDPSGGAE